MRDNGSVSVKQTRIQLIRLNVHESFVVVVVVVDNDVVPSANNKN